MARLIAGLIALAWLLNAYPDFQYGERMTAEHVQSK